MAEIWRLDDMTIDAIKGPEQGKKVMRRNDGGGLFLRVTKHTDKRGVERVSKSWEFFFTMNGTTSCTGLGPYAPSPKAPGLTLKAARNKAHDLRQLIEDGKNPVQDKAAKKAAQIEAERLQQVEDTRRKTFKQAVEDYLEKKDAELSNDRHRQEWRSSFNRYAIKPDGWKGIGDMLISEITMQDMLLVLNQKFRDKSGKVIGTLWECRTETASRLRNRIEAVLSWATVKGYRTGDNPARWAGNLKELLPAPSKIAKKDNQPALAVSDIPTWFADLRKRTGMGARALEFAVLCASRSGEVRGMTWDEVHDLDGDRPMWIIGKDRMKMENEHRVPLSPDAVSLLKALPRMPGNDLVFFAARGGQLSDMTISKVMKLMHGAKLKKDDKGWIDPKSKRPAVPHGTCRSTFRQWAAECGVGRDLAEMALAHKVGDETERAYQRSDMVERRRALGVAWAAYCRGDKSADNVVPLRSGAA